MKLTLLLAGLALVSCPAFAASTDTWDCIPATGRASVHHGSVDRITVQVFRENTTGEATSLLFSYPGFSVSNPNHFNTPFSRSEWSGSKTRSLTRICNGARAGGRFEVKSHGESAGILQDAPALTKGDQANERVAALHACVSPAIERTVPGEFSGILGVGYESFHVYREQRLNNDADNSFEFARRYQCTKRAR
jgi:hypothetical protein